MKTVKKYFKHKIEKVLVINKIITLGRFSLDKDFNADEETHDFWETVYISRGSIFCTVGEQQLILNEGDILFHRPNERHALHGDSVNASDVWVVTFECRSESVQLFDRKKFKLTNEQRSLLYDIISEGEKTFDILTPDPYAKKIELLDSPPLGGLQLIKNYLELFLIKLLRTLTETPDGNSVFLPEKEFESKLTEDVKKILTDNICNSLSIEDICKQLHYSRSYIFKMFRRSTGKSIMEYFIYLKTEKAKSLLLNDLTVSEISKLLSFDTPNYFTKTFKRVTGMTPTEYRKKLKA